MQKIKDRKLVKVQQHLEEELSSLKDLLPFEELLKVCWKPHPSSISGEVMGDTIYIYDENLREAADTLKHEYIDYLLTRRLVDPLVAVINTFVKLREREIYREKELIVNRLSKLV